MAMPSGPRILVPILGGDIGPATLARARTVASARGARLALIHVVRGADDADSSPGSKSTSDARPRWRQLAGTCLVFVDAVAGDPASVILSQADRFASDVVLFGRPEEITGDNAWIATAAERVRRAAPARIEVIDEPAALSRSMPARSTRTGSTVRTTTEPRTSTQTVEAAC